MKKVMILNPYVFTLGGGEKQMGYLCKFIEDYYDNDVVIDIIVHSIDAMHDYDNNPITVKMINDRFGLNLKHTNIIKIISKKPHNKIEFLIEKNKVESISKKYDIFINFKFMSKHEGRAKKNIYECMFPPKRFEQEINKRAISRYIAKFFDKKFAKSYDVFLANSGYTEQWLKLYWDGLVGRSEITYPPVFQESEAAKWYDETKKENIILSVGRFFKGAHCKKQKEMLSFFINNINMFEGYEYHLAGAVSDMEEDRQYLDELIELAKPYGNIFIHENCKYNELLKLYTKSKIFWHATGYLECETDSPEKMEHFGITTVEAMSFGVVPVVISRGGQKEIVDEGVNGYLWNDENDCISNTITLFDDSHREQMAIAAVFKSKNYSIEQFNKVHFELFKEMGL